MSIREERIYYTHYGRALQNHDLREVTDSDKWKARRARVLAMSQDEMIAEIARLDAAIRDEFG